jgi:hypothetical protein
MIYSLFLLTLLSCQALFCQPQLPQHNPDHTALDNFLLFMGDIRTATPYAGVAKTKAINLFTELFKQADKPIKDLLHEFVDHLKWIMKRRLMFASTKNKLCLLLLNDTRTKLDTLSKGKREITVRVKKLISAIYTAINPTFGDFWRNVRTVSAISGGIAAATYLGYQMYNLKNVLANESGPFNQMVKLLVDIHKYKDPNDPHGPSELIKFVSAATKNMSATEKGSFGKLMDIIEKVHTERPDLITEIAEILNKTLRDEQKGSFGHLMDILKQMPQNLIHGAVPPMIAYLKAKS